MGRDLDDIMAVEMVDLQPYNPPRPDIDEVRHLVRAPDHRRGHAIAVHRDSMGCTVLPPHWTEADAAKLPYVQYKAAPNVENKPYPEGDRVKFHLNRRQQAVLDRAFTSNG